MDSAAHGVEPELFAFPSLTHPLTGKSERENMQEKVSAYQKIFKLNSSMLKTASTTCTVLIPEHARCLAPLDRLIGLVVKASTLRAADPGFESRLRRDFSRSSHTIDLEIGTPLATLPDAWCYRVSVGTGWPGVSILWLGEVESLIRNFYLSDLYQMMDMWMQIEGTKLCHVPAPPTLLLPPLRPPRWPTG